MCEGEKKRRGHAVAVVWYFCWMEDSKTSGEFKSLKAIDRQFCIARYSNSPSVLSQGVNKFKVESLRPAGCFQIFAQKHCLSYPWLYNLLTVSCFFDDVACDFSCSIGRLLLLMIFFCSRAQAKYSEGSYCVMDKKISQMLQKA